MQFKTQTFKIQGASRTEEFDGKSYSVVPIIAMIEGVRFGAAQELPELGLAEDFGKNPVTWNTKPVVLGHPQKDSTYISACTPDVINAIGFGQIFNTQLKGKKLHMEAWLDNSKRELSNDITKVFERIENDEIVEVSVGFFCDLIDEVGEYDGQEYEGVWKNIVPDHLAILPENEIGACSVEDGCGTRVQNKLKGIKMSECACNIKKEVTPENIIAQIRTNAVPAEIESSNTRVLLNELISKTYNNWSYVITNTDNSVTFYDDKTGTTKRRNYNINTDMSVSFSDTAEEEVVILIDVQPLKVNSNGENMTTQTNGQPDEIIESTEAVEGTELVETTAPVEVVESEDGVEITEPEPEITVESYIANAPEAIRDMLQEGLRANNAKRTGLISKIKANSANKFKDDFLKVQSTETLENLAALASVATQSGKQGVVPQSLQVQSDSVPTPPKVFEYKKVN